MTDPASPRRPFLRKPTRPLWATVLTGLLLSLPGCGGSSPEFVEVRGVVIVDGKPVSRLYVQFLPDPDKGNDLAANSSGETNEAGEFELTYNYDGKEGQGAAVGWHRVIVEDTRLSSVQQGAALPPQLIAPDYANVARTPLSIEVKPEGDPIELKLKKSLAQ